MGELPPLPTWHKGPLPFAYRMNEAWIKAFPFIACLIIIVGSAAIIGKEIYQRNHHTTLDELQKIPLNNLRSQAH